MRKLLSSCAFLIGLSLMAGCATTTSGLGDEAGTVRLPSGLTLLDSDTDDCDGTVQLGDEMIEGRGLREEFFVDAGQNATFELERGYDEIEWVCVEGSSPRVESVRCPSGTTHLRLTRAAAGGELLFECYG